jgi:hypothetical protein
VAAVEGLTVSLAVAVATPAEAVNVYVPGVFVEYVMLKFPFDPTEADLVPSEVVISTWVPVGAGLEPSIAVPLSVIGSPAETGLGLAVRVTLVTVGETVLVLPEPPVPP